MGKVQDKVAVVTGAGGMLGGATAKLLASEGAKIMATGRHPENTAETAAAIKESGGEAVSMAHDVAEEAQWEAVIAATLERFGRLDIMVNNAGHQCVSPIEDFDYADWRRVIDVNLGGTFLGTRAAVRVMKESGGGAIVNISSVGGLVGTPGLSAYCSAKAGVTNLTRAAALECGRNGYNIRVNSVHPGYIHRGRRGGTARKISGKSEKEALADLLKLFPIGHFGKPADIANAVLYLASDDSAFVTGTQIVVDGGYTAQ